MSDLRIEERSFQFSIKVIKLYKALIAQKEFVLSKQLLRSGTSIGANLHEAQAAYSKKDFAHKVSIASKEARETQYWLRLIDEGSLVNVDVSNELDEIGHIANILTAIVKTSQENLNRASKK